MKSVVMFALVLLAAAVFAPNNGFCASARCVVVEKKGTLLVMDCGDRAAGFPKKSRVKIKTDRDRQ